MPRVTTTVAQVRRHGDRAVTLGLDLAGASFPYRPGQYVLIDPRQFANLREGLERREAQVGKRESPACFSLSSDGLDPRRLEVSVKLAPDGVPSSPLVHYLVGEIATGERVELEGPGGRYCLPADPPPGIEGYLHLCAGSGVAPNRGMIRHALGRGWPQRHLLIVQDRASKDALFLEEWPDLAARHPDRFRHRAVYSRDSGARITEALVLDAMRGFIVPERAAAFVCGPNAARPGSGGEEPGFRDFWAGRRGGGPGLLAGMGFAVDRIVVEEE